MSGGVIPQKSGWAKGAAVRYWDLGDAPQVGALLYVLVARTGDQVVPLGHPYVGLALPGDPRYSPFLFVQHVVVTDRYGGEVLKAECGMLVCLPRLSPFYARRGWEPVTQPVWIELAAGTVPSPLVVMVRRLGDATGPAGPGAVGGKPW